MKEAKVIYRWTRVNVCIWFFCFLFFTSPIYAQVNFSWGSQWRLRYEYWKNWKDMDNGQKDNRNYFRVKTSLWGKADFDINRSLFVKLTNEFKGHVYFGGTASAFPDKSATKKGYHFDINEVIFENLYLDESNFLSLPVTLRLGRQDFAGLYGEGFLIMDGTPQDGPRTLYFNAAKASWLLNEKNKVDMIYINDPRDEEFLPAINKKMFVQANAPWLDKVPQPLNTTDEAGGILYWKNNDIENLAFENYYIFKSESEQGGVGYQSKKGAINTLGSFIKYAKNSLVLRGQIANQFGTYGSNNRTGIGGYFFLDNTFKDILWSPMASIGYVYLSGDKTKTEKNEGWDPVFSRWFWISELYAMSMCAETGINGYWTNMRIYRLNLVLKPTKKINLSFWYNFLQANEQVNATSILSGNGKNRGHLPQIKLEYLVNKNITTYCLAEYLIPGNFYKNKDPALFLRTEIQIKF